MENLNLINFNMENFSPEQLEQIQERARDTRIKKLENQYIEITDKLEKTQLKVDELDNDCKKLNQDNKKLINQIEETQKDYKNLKDVTYVLATDDCKSKELTKTIKARVFKFTGSKDNPMYILFYRYFINACYSKLYDIFEKTSYKRISIDDFDLAMKSVSSWFPTKKLKNDKILEYQKLQDKGLLDSIKSKALDKYLDEINGGLN